MSEISLTLFKVCTKCGCTKPASLAFYAPAKRVSSGLTSNCRICKAAQDRQYYLDNRERKSRLQKEWVQRNREAVSKYQKRYRTENRERLDEYNLRYQRENKEAISKQKRAYREANPEREAERCRNYREKNREAISQQKRIYRLNNKEAAAEAQRKWRKENPEAARKSKYKYYATKKNAEYEPYTDADLNRLWHEQKGCCAYCKTLLFDNYHRDHVIPLSRGGADKLENIALSCPLCNMRKNARSAEEFVKILKKEGGI